MVLTTAFGLSPALAQSTGTLAGRVTDAKSGDPLPGANVFILGTIMGTSTDLDGFYSLKLPPGKYQVRINYISYKTVT
ncbi:MAG: carboxypeptidase-like regulatory domain-containing protein, partial [Calditrichaeota bacterium]|nr:carboxypeptidase-like regulatory domain-containing protein [Calditrichota bacterium]